MDFLDPKRRRAHRRRLFVGYVLMSIVVAISTMIILYLAYGYDIDRKTGTVIQNGIVFLDSEPGGAKVFLNGAEQGDRTGSRLVLPAGDYTIRLEADGYRTWERTFNLEGGQIQRLVYPFLIPSSLSSENVRTYNSLPALATQSPDRRWVLVSQPGETYEFDLFDLRDSEKAPIEVVIPNAILTKPTVASQLKVVEWANDNRHVLLHRTGKGINEFLRLDRERSSESLNINTTLGITAAEVTLRDHHPERVYYLDARPGTLRSADLKSRTISAPLISKVSYYATRSDNVVLYVTEDENTPKDKVDYRILENETSYTLRSLSKADRYILAVSRYEGDWFYVVGSSADNIAYVYENPLPTLKKESNAPLSVAALMRITNPQFASFSPDDQFVVLQKDNQLLVLDLEDRRQYLTTLEHEIAADYKVTWMDSHHLLYTSQNKAYVIDFDGSNEQQLVAHEVGSGPFFDPDYNRVFSLSRSATDRTKKALLVTALEN